jgi:hypothetical protein
MAKNNTKNYDVSSDKTNSNNVNKGMPIYYNNELHYIVYEFDDKMIISQNKDLTKAFSVNKSKLSVKQKK